MRRAVPLILTTGLTLFASCKPPYDAAACLGPLGTNNEWGSEEEVAIDGYNENAMEPRISADETTIFWNNKPADDRNMDIHYAVKQASGRYQYIGTVNGTVANNHLDGVPAVDNSGNFYFVSVRSYDDNQQSLYGGQVEVTGPNALQVTSVAPADDNISQRKAGKIDMDVDVSWDGSTMVVSRAVFTGDPFPETSELALFSVANRQATPLANGASIMAKVNREECRTYAGALSNDKLELYYTVLPVGTPETTKDFRIVVAKRPSETAPFEAPAVIAAITGESLEGPSLSVDGKRLYYHRLDKPSGRFKIYRVKRP